MARVWDCLKEQAPASLSPLHTLLSEKSTKLSHCYTRTDRACVPGILLSALSCWEMLLFGVLEAGRVTLLRESQRKRMSFNPIPKSPSRAAVGNTMLDDTTGARENWVNVQASSAL